MQVPRHLWDIAKTREFVRALGTTDLREAERLKHNHVAEFKRRISELERRGDDPMQEVFQKALAFKDAMARNAGRLLDLPEHCGDVPVNEMILSDALDEAKDIVDEFGDEVARRFMQVVEGAALLRDLYPRWLDETAPPPKRRDLYLVALKAFIAWAGPHVTTEEVTRAKAGGFISFLLDGTRTAATVDRYRSTLATLWRWLGEKGLVDRDRNPWLDHSSIRRSGSAKPKTKRKGLTDEQLEKVLSGTYSGAYAQAIADLTRLTLVTGARLEELGRLKRTDIETRGDGKWLAIRDGKTEAAVRLIPVHRSVNHILQRRLRRKRELLFDDLHPGPYGRRTHHLSKVYGRFRKEVGVGERGADFHALRHTFTSAMEGAGVPLPMLQLIVGHSRMKSMGTTAVYAHGTRVDLRKLIARLRYAPRIMRLLESEPSKRQRGGQ